MFTVGKKTAKKKKGEKLEDREMWVRRDKFHSALRFPCVNPMNAAIYTHTHTYTITTHTHSGVAIYWHKFKQPPNITKYNINFEKVYFKYKK